VARRSRPRGWPEPPEPLPVSVVDNHTHLETVVAFLGDGTEVDDGGVAGAARGGPEVDDGDARRPYPPRTMADHLALASAVGVPRMVQVGCDVEAARWTDAAVREYDALLGAVAIHPNEAVLHAGVREVAPDGLEPQPQPRHDVPLDEAVAQVAAIARENPRIRAIGETGLDFFRAGERGRAVQREAFRAHIALAKELGLALQIHDRDAHAEVIEVLERDGAPERTVFHCFSGDASMANLCAERGWYLSFAGPVTYPANAELRRALRATPVDLLLVETDAPYLTPHPLRGRPNAPYLMPHTVRAIAREREMAVEDLCGAVVRTCAAVYGTWAG
jgi:TatD DNase family protein